MVSKFAGKRYKLHSSENLDAYLSINDASMTIRALAKIVKPTIELVIEGDTYILKSITGSNSRDVTFKIGEEFEQTLIDGRKILTTFVLEGDNKLIETHKGPKSSIVIREFSDDEVKITMTTDGVTAVRIFKAE